MTVLMQQSPVSCLQMLFHLDCFLLMYDLFLQTLSSWGNSSIEEVASTGPGLRFFQLYVRLIIHLPTSFIFMVYEPITSP